MDQQQRKYALERVDAILTQKIAALMVKHTVPGKSLTRDEKLEMLNSGKVKASFEAGYYSSDIKVKYDFSKYEKAETLSAAGTKAIEAIKKKAQETKDTIMLGEASAAAQAIAAFEK